MTTILAALRLSPSSVRGLGSLALRTLCLGALAAIPATAVADNVRGTWSPVKPWPLIAIHAAVTPDGRVLSYGTDLTGRQTGYFKYDIWNPADGLDGGHFTLDNLTLTDIFCSSQIVLPQSGDVMIAGGDNWTGTGTTNTGNNNSNLFSPSGNTLTRGVNMNRARWYSSSTVLLNGEIYIQGGSGGGDFPEVRTADGAFRLLGGAPTGGYAALFPRNFLAPDGRVFGYDTNGRMYYVATGGTGAIAAAGQFPSANAGWTSGAAMYRPGRILQIGGNSNGALMIDITGPQPVYAATQSMSSQRMWVSATVLPDGKVLATGGSQAENQLVGVNNIAEIWNPATGQWTQGAAAVNARLYHSSALLLPDATVLVGGGGAPGPLTNLNVEVYYPPYLYGANGQLAARPVIENAPANADVGTALTVQVGAGTVSRVTLVKTGSVTHSVNMDQRFIELPFSASANLLSVQLPAQASDTPPGYYLLFVLNSAGVPSVAKILRINVAANPSAALDYTPTVGGGGGSSFTVGCNADEVLVGAYGNTATYVNQVGPRCVKMDQFGHWIGDPVNRGLTGSTTSGSAYVRTCPRDWAVSGFRGLAATYVRQLDFECKALTPTGTVSGAAQYLGAVGGTGDPAVGPYSCGTGNPARAFYGRSGGWIDSFGVLCQRAPITPIAVNSAPAVTNPGAQSGLLGSAVGLAIAASDADGDVLGYTAAGLPPGLAIDASTGYITGTPAATGNYNVTVTVSDGAAATSVAFAWTIGQSTPLTVDPMPAQAPIAISTVANYTASAHGGSEVRYKWFFDDGTAETAWSASPSIAHTFATPGVHYVTLTVTDASNATNVQIFAQAVHLPLAASQPTASTNIAIGGGRLWVVNPDNDSVTVFDAASRARLAEVAVGAGPRTVALAPDGSAWVTNKLGASISVVDPATGTVSRTLALPAGSQPFGLAFAPGGGSAYVVLEATGQLLKLDPATGAVLSTADIGPNPRHLAIASAGDVVYVSRFITPPLVGEGTLAVDTATGGGELLVLDAATLAVARTITLRDSDKPDFENQGSGVPNYLGAAAISPDGSALWVPSKQDNVRRGTARNGSNLNFQSTVRAITSRIDPATGTELYAARLDHDNSSVASAAAYDRWGLYLFVALETSREVAVVDAHFGYEMFRIDVGHAPGGLAVSPDGSRLYVSNFMDRTVDEFDLSALTSTGQWSAPRVATLQAVTSERLAPTVLKGKQLFYDARDPRLARDRYMSCATCHNDGGQDGRVWDLTGLGEGLRNTVALRGRGGIGHGMLHWSGNFDEVQDFEGQIRLLSEGTGLMDNSDFAAGTRSEPLGDPKAGLSADLDAMAAYLASLDSFAPSPYRNADGSLPAEAVTGKAVFAQAGCAGCHGGARYTDSSTIGPLHDIGTLKPASGNRLNGPLTGLDAPTLRDVWNTAPYLHDGSAPTLADAVRAHTGIALGAADVTAVVAYLRAIGSQEGAAPVANAPPTISNPGDQSGQVGTSVDLAITAGDSDGDALVFTATGLPAGLSIDAATGSISGTPTVAGTSSVTVSVSDNQDSRSVAFTWTLVAPDTTPPAKVTGLTLSRINGFPHLVWTASTDNVGVVAYAIFRSTDGTKGSEVARVDATTWDDPATQEGLRYTYSVIAYDAAGNAAPLSSLRSIVAYQAPTVPGAFTVTLVGGKPQLTWTASTDNVGVAGYIIYRSTTTKLGPEIARTAATAWQDAGAVAGVRYTYAVKAYDAAGYLSGRTALKTITSQ